jgi:pimeloyl-ACP methyl ester carboxylesterase
MRLDQVAQLENGLGVRFKKGAGDTILWIHGYTLDASIWNELWDLLPDWSHLGIDLPGHGIAREIPLGESLPELAAQVAKLAVDRQVRHLVGLSFGTVVALQVAMQLPEAFVSMVLGSPSFNGGPQDLSAQARNIELMELYKEHGPGPWMTELWMKSPPDIFKGAAANPRLWQKLREVVEAHSWEELENLSMSYLSKYPQPEKDFRLIRAATLLIIGEEDMAAFKRSGELLRRNIPDCRRIYLPEAGHLSLLEKPGIVSSLIHSHLLNHSK